MSFNDGAEARKCKEMLLELMKEPGNKRCADCGMIRDNIFEHESIHLAAFTLNQAAILPHGVPMVLVSSFALSVPGYPYFDYVSMIITDCSLTIICSVHSLKAICYDQIHRNLGAHITFGLSLSPSH